MTLITNISAIQYQADYLDNDPCIPITSLIDFFDPCFILKHDDDCTELYLEDKTDYQGINLDDITVTVNLKYRNDMNEQYVQLCGTSEIIKETKLNYLAEFGNGEYLFTIEVSYDNAGTIYTKTIELCITLDCCKCNIQDLKDEIKEKIASISCKINDYECIGRNSLGLYSALYSLSNALFYLETSNITTYCNDKELVGCFLNSIKNYC